MMNFTFVIVNWKVRDYLFNCLKSIFEEFSGFKNAEVIVVDNDSRDGTGAMMSTKFDWARFIPLNENIGFARANNMGARQGRGDYFIFINPDTIIPRGFKSKIENFTESNPDIVFFGGRILNPDGSLQRSIRRFPGFWDQIFRSLKLNHVLPRAKIWRKYIAEDFDYSRMSRAEQIMGAFMVIKRDVFWELKGFREDFFLWFEEVDLCRRAWELGIEVWYTSDVELIHIGSQSFSQISEGKQFIFTKSLIKYLWLHKNYAACLAVAAALPANICLTYLGKLFSRRS